MFLHTSCAVEPVIVWGPAPPQMDGPFTGSELAVFDYWPTRAWRQPALRSQRETCGWESFPAWDTTLLDTCFKLIVKMVLKGKRIIRKENLWEFLFCVKGFRVIYVVASGSDSFSRSANAKLVFQLSTRKLFCTLNLISRQESWFCKPERFEMKSDCVHSSQIIPMILFTGPSFPRWVLDEILSSGLAFGFQVELI